MASNRQPLKAEIHTDERGSVQRTVRLSAFVSSAADQAGALIHDLSETGLRLETASEFDPGEALIVELPFVGIVKARIVGKEANSYECRLLNPVSRATIDAALLNTRSIPPVQGDEAAVIELALGVNPSLEQISGWAIELEKSKDKSGYQLLGFRKSDDGVINALLCKNK